MRRPFAVVAAVVIGSLLSCTPSVRDRTANESASSTARLTTSTESPYLLVSAGDEDGAESDFLAVIDLRAGSETFAKVLSTLPTGLRNSMPHHMEYSLPPAGELLFLNAHHAEASLLVDVS
ncbi:MAG: hypothetical protein ABI120_00455, partial [Gemmatimonadaceae bacterium]